MPVHMNRFYYLEMAGSLLLLLNRIETAILISQTQQKVLNNLQLSQSMLKVTIFFMMVMMMMMTTRYGSSVSNGPSVAFGNGQV